MQANLGALPREKTRMRPMETETVMKTRVKVSVVSAGSGANHINTICFRFGSNALLSLGYDAKDPQHCAFALRGTLKSGISLALVGDGEGRKYNEYGGLRFAGHVSDEAGFTNNIVQQEEIEATIDPRTKTVHFGRFPQQFFEAHNPTTRVGSQAGPHGYHARDNGQANSPEQPTGDIAPLESEKAPTTTRKYTKRAKYWTDAEERKRKMTRNKSGGQVPAKRGKRAQGFDPAMLKYAVDLLNEQVELAEDAGAEVVFGKTGSRMTAHLRMEIA